jgi:hypothetical protein
MIMNERIFSYLGAMTAFLMGTVIILNGSAIGALILRDDFNVANNYSGAFPTGPTDADPSGMWDGLYNRNAGGGPTDANITSPGNLNVGLQNVGWEGANLHNLDTGAFLFRRMDAAELVSIRTRISSQSVGNWSDVGILIRNPASAPINGNAANEDFILNYSFRGSPTNFENEVQNIRNGNGTTTDNFLASAAQIEYLRVDNLGGGKFNMYRGSGPNESSITWVLHTVSPITNSDLASGIIEVGLTGGDLKGGVGGSAQFDWVTIEIIPEPLSCILVILASLTLACSHRRASKRG